MAFPGCAAFISAGLLPYAAAHCDGTKEWRAYPSTPALKLSSHARTTTGIMLSSVNLKGRKCGAVGPKTQADDQGELLCAGMGRPAAVKR